MPCLETACPTAIHNRPVQVFHATPFALSLPAGHRFPMAKYALLRERLAAELPGIVLIQAPPATDAELERVHSRPYVRAISDGSIDAKAMREIGFPWSLEMVERSRCSVGATISACNAALRDGVAGNIAGGTHHATADKGSGFCVFNDVAVAARLIQGGAAAGAGIKVAVIDLDVHQGNGTASIFRDDDRVFTLSLHGAKNFPFRKEAGDLDVDLPDGCRDEDYLAALDAALAELARRFEPGLVIYLAGADPHEGDRLGRLKLTWDGLAERDRRVFEWAWRRHLPLAFAMAGGYGTRIEDTVQVQVNTFAVAAGYFRRWRSLEQ